MKKTVIFVSILIFAVATTNAQDVVTRTVNEIKSYEPFFTGQVALLAVDMKTGEEIAAYNPDMSVIPASNTKLFSTAAALELYGADYTYKTELYYTGKLDSAAGLLNGDIIIRGSGDPTLGSRFFSDQPNYKYNETFVNAIKEAGIKNISGNVVGDGTLYSKEMTPPTWIWEDIGNYFGAVPNGLTVHDNLVTLHFKTGRDGTEAIYMSCDPDIKGLNVESHGKASDVPREYSNTFGKTYQLSKYVTGPMPQNRSDVTVRSILPDPPLYAATRLTDSLNSNGIKVLGKAVSAVDYSRYQNDKPAMNLIATVESPTLADIIRQTNLFSVNLFAEHCLSLVGIKQVNTSDVPTAAWALMAFWKSKGMNIKGLSLNDGCGLSHFNIVSPRHLTFLLTYMHNESSNYEVFNNSLSMCGVKGTMATMCPNTRAVNNARGKSGTMTRIKSYSGYVTSRSGREIAFAIIANNFTCTSTDTRKMMEKFIISLADYNK